MKKRLLIFFGVLLLAVYLLVSWASWNPEPEVNSKKILDARESTRNTILNEQANFQKNLNYTFYTQDTSDTCYSGQNNTKVRTEYVYRCTYKIRNYYGFNGDLRDRLVSLEEYLTTNGWHDRYASLPDVINNYYDEYHNRPFPCGRLTCPPPPGLYTAVDLPEADYEKTNLIAEFEYSEKSSPRTRTKSEFDLSQRTDTEIGSFFEDKQEANIDEFIDKAFKDNNYLISIAISKHYYVDDLNILQRALLKAPFISWFIGFPF